jgi:hypothetical protein
LALVSHDRQNNLFHYLSLVFLAIAWMLWVAEVYWRASIPEVTRFFLYSNYLFGDLVALFAIRLSRSMAREGVLTPPASRVLGLSGKSV